MIAEDVLAETETQAADMLSALRCGQSLSVGMLSVSRCRSILSCRRRARAALLGARPLSADAAPGLQDRALWGRGSRSDRQQAVNMIAAGCADWRAPAARLLAACHKPAHQPHRHSTGSFCPRSCCLLQLRLCLPPGSQARVLVAQGVVAATGMCTQDAVRPAGHGRVGRHRRRRAGGGPGRPALPPVCAPLQRPRPAGVGRAWEAVPGLLSKQHTHSPPALALGVDGRGCPLWHLARPHGYVLHLSM